jgi:hypothetical protein
VWRRGWAVPWLGVLGLHPQTLPARPLKGLAAFNVHPTSTHVLRLGFAFGPSQRSTIPPVLWPLLTSPQRTATSRSPLSMPPGEHAKRGRHPKTPVEISSGKTSNLHHAPAAYTSRSLDDIGLRHLQPARPDRAASNAIRVPRVADSSSGFLPTPPHSDAVAIDLWLVPSTPTGDSHPQAADHAERTATGSAFTARGPTFRMWPRPYTTWLMS